MPGPRGRRAEDPVLSSSGHHGGHSRETSSREKGRFCSSIPDSTPACGNHSPNLSPSHSLWPQIPGLILLLNKTIRTNSAPRIAWLSPTFLFSLLPPRRHAGSQRRSVNGQVLSAGYGVLGCLRPPTCFITAPSGCLTWSRTLGNLSYMCQQGDHLHLYIYPFPQHPNHIPESRGTAQLPSGPHIAQKNAPSFAGSSDVL